ncbi:hypothetical protein SAMN04488691_105151 [Haloferax larsenii]|uniref:Uncharacterized protein n=1 Tax=Haloferax larsenii TaxID=302484 RepID=A0A1H7QTH8_HALLR|nr:hypothetical protein SAMN04488691_105151 [Haloferax larsenii]
MIVVKNSELDTTARQTAVRRTATFAEMAETMRNI